jgi:hypothetical protein
MNEPRSRRRFLQITAVGAGAATGAALTGVNQAAAVTSGLTSLTHPGVLDSRADLDRMRTKVAAGAEPWLSGYNAFAADFYRREAGRPRNSPPRSRCSRTSSCPSSTSTATAAMA